MKRIAAVLALLLAAAATALAVRHARAPVVTITYYFIPGCSTCQHTEERIRRIVAPYGHKVAFRSIDNTSPEGKDAIVRYRFGSHGVVVEDDRGAPHVDFVEADHRVYPDHIASALQRLVPGGAGSS